MEENIQPLTMSHFHNVLQISNDIFYTVQFPSRVKKYMNRTLPQLLGYGSKEIEINKLCHPEDVANLDTFWIEMQTLDDGIVLSNESRMKSANGTWWSILTQATVTCRNSDGSVEIVTASASNSSVGKWLEEERKQVNLLKESNNNNGIFLKDVTDKLKAPIYAAENIVADLLSSTHELDPGLSQKIQMLSRNIRRVHKLVDAQDDFAKLEKGKLDAVFQPTDIGSFTKFIAEQFRSVIESKGLRYTIKIPLQDITIYTCHQMWEKVVAVLLSNAFAFTTIGKIQLSIRSNRKHFRLAVSDTGCGIAPKSLETLFDKFSRSENSSTIPQQRPCLGLSTAKEIIGMHGGTIKVKSTEGVGTTFTVSLPTGKSHLPPKQIHELKADFSDYATGASAHVPENRSPLTKPKRKQKLSDELRYNILVIEQNPILGEYLQNTLPNHYNLLHVNTWQQITDTLENSATHLIITDAFIDGFGGMQVLTHVLGNEKTRSIPVILFSPCCDDDYRVRALEAGAVDFIDKPFVKGELKARIRARLREKEFVLQA